MSITKTIASTKQFELSLTLDRSARDSFTFTNFDKLKGKLHLIPKKTITNINSIDIAFEGYTKTALPGSFKTPDFSSQLYGGPSVDKQNLITNPFLQSNFSFLENNLTVECHNLVHQKKSLYHYHHHHHQQDGFFLPGTSYSYDFEIIIPSEARCCLLDQCDNHNDTVFHIDPLTNCKIKVPQHKRNLYLGKRKVLNHHLPPSIGVSLTQKKTSDLFNVFYYLKVSVVQDTKKQKDSITEGYYEINFLPREFSVDVWARDRRSMKIVNNKSGRLFKLESDSMKQTLLDYKKSLVDPTLSSPSSKYNNKFKSKSYKSMVENLKKFPSFDDSLYLEMRLYESEYFTPSSTPKMKLFLVSLKNPNDAKSLITGEKISGIQIRNLIIDLTENYEIKNQSINGSKKENYRTAFHGQDQEFITDQLHQRINLFKTPEDFSHDISLEFDGQTNNVDVKYSAANPCPCSSSSPPSPPPPPPSSTTLKFIKNVHRLSSLTNEPIYECEIPFNDFVNVSSNSPKPNSPGMVIPADVIPSFRSCNIKKSYGISVKCDYIGILPDSVAISPQQSLLTGSQKDRSGFSFKKITRRDSPTIDETARTAFDFKIKILSGISNIIEPVQVCDDLNYTEQDVMDLSTKLETLPLYDDLFNNVDHSSTLTSVSSLSSSGTRSINDDFLVDFIPRIVNIDIANNNNEGFGLVEVI